MKLAANLKNERFFLKLIDDGKLKVTKLGRAYNLVTGREIGTTNRVDEYRKLSWMHPVTKKIIQVQLHRIVWAKYKGIPTDPFLLVNHEDGDKQNCALTNLVLDTAKYNSQHAVRTGLLVAPKAEENGNAHFTNEQVLWARKMFALGKKNIKELSITLDSGEWNVVSMIKGLTYKSVVSGKEKACVEKWNRNRKNSGKEGKRISEETVKRIRNMRREKGLSVYRIAEDLGIARNTVMKYW